MKIDITPIDITQTHTIISNLNHLPGFIWLDSSDKSQANNRWSIIGFNPLKQATTWPQWQEIAHYLDNQTPSKKRTVEAPFYTGILGFLSFEAASNWMPESLFKLNSTFPQCYGGLYHQVILINHHNNHAYYCQSHYADYPPPQSLDQILNDISKNAEIKRENKQWGKAPITQISKDDYIQKIITAKHHIFEGDCYQLNLSHQFKTPISKPPFDLYLQLRENCPIPYAAYVNTGDHHILSASPETLFKTDGKSITTRPIKGTIKRGDTPSQDSDNKAQLQRSEKDQAELMMITDLERNDLGKLCVFGTVIVPELKTLETYPNVHHLVSTITGTLRPNISLTDILQALFPGGSITGAPKKRAMEIINQLEPTSRNIYTGSIGYYDITKKSEFNIAIRTMYTIGDTLYSHSGGGITADSIPQAEWDETITKASALLKTIQ